MTPQGQHLEQNLSIFILPKNVKIKSEIIFSLTIAVHSTETSPACHQLLHGLRQREEFTCRTIPSMIHT